MIQASYVAQWLSIYLPTQKTQVKAKKKLESEGFAGIANS